MHPHTLFTRARLSLAIALLSPLAAMPLKSMAESLSLEEVVVTAQRREQNAMEVPISMNTFSNKDMENTGALTLNDIDAYIPGFEVGEGVTQSTLSIRGVTSPSISAGGDPSVAAFYDDAYLPSAATTIAFADMAQIDVLKGPQGTLFGRNAAAGAVVMVPNKPSEDVDAFVATKIGNYGLVRTEAMFNAPLSDTVYVRANLMSNQRDGYIDNTVGRDSGEQENLSARLSLLWNISDATSLQVSYDWDKVDNSPRAAIGFSDRSLNTDPFSRKVANDLIDGEETRDMYAVSTKLLHEFNDEFSLKWINSYRAFETSNREEEDGTADAQAYLDTNNIFDNDILYEELQLNFTSEQFSGVVGVNYSVENVNQTTRVTALGDSVTGLVTQDLTHNPMLQGMIYQGTIDYVNQQTAPAVQGGLMTQAEADAIAQAQADQSLAALESVDNLWNPNDWATFTTLLGVGPLPQDDVYYDAVAQSLGTSMLFGLSHAGQQWQESVINEGKFVNYGIFADGEFSVTDDFRLLAGLRYSHDKKDFSWQVPGVNFNRATVPGTAPIEPVIFRTGDGYVVGDQITAASETWSKITGRLVGQYDINEDVMTFLSYATGYKSGGFDSLDQSTAITSIKPEEVTNIEWGIKGDLLDGKARVQFSYFDMAIDGRQRSVESKPPGQVNALPRVINGDQQFNGFELTFDWLPTDTVRLGLVTTIRDEESTWATFYNALGELQSDKVTGSTDTAYTLTFDWAPEVSFGALNWHADYVYAENNAELDPGAITSVQIGGQDTAIPHFGEDSKLLNSRLGWSSNDGHYEVALWGHNLLDNKVTNSLGGRTLDVFGTGYLDISAPRTYGIDLRYNL